MPGRDAHLPSVDRFERFERQINTPAQEFREWVVIVWFHIAIQYVDAFLAVHGDLQVSDHSDRWAKLAAKQKHDSRVVAVGEELHELYKDAKQARYQGREYDDAKFERARRRYEMIRRTMRAALGLSD